MMRPTLVTGAAGFAGGHLLDLLAAGDESVVAWHRPGSAPPREVANVSWQAIDMRDGRAIRAAIASMRPARVYHCAGAAHVGRSWSKGTETLDVNVMGTHRLVEALRHEAPDARMLLTSSGLVYEPGPQPMDENHARVPGSPYGLSKLAQEMVGDDLEGAPAVIVARPFNHIGPRQSASFVVSAFAKQIAEIERRAEDDPSQRFTMRVGNLDPRRDFCDVRDTVRAYALLMEQGRPGRIYNVCSGTASSARDILEALLALTHISIDVVGDPSLYRPNDLPLVVGDPSRIVDEIGWRPTIPFAQTIRDVLNDWRERVRRS